MNTGVYEHETEILKQDGYRIYDDLNMIEIIGLFKHLKNRYYGKKIFNSIISLGLMT
jgi:hypothetical protein